jgi:hypothetical protein
MIRSTLNALKSRKKPRNQNRNKIFVGLLRYNVTIQAEHIMLCYAILH